MSSPAPTQAPIAITVGFAGLGKMGSGMAKRLLASGHRVRVYNRSAAAAEPLVRLGAVAVASPAELAGVDVLFTMLANAEVTEAVVVGSGLLDAMAAAPRTPLAPSESAGAGGRLFFRQPIHVLSSTVSPAFVTAQAALHAARGVTLLSMPVCGRPAAAEAGTLHLLLAGPADARDALRPLLVPFVGQSLREFGSDAAQGAVIKIAFNFTLAGMLETLCEGSALVQKYGIAAGDYTELVSNTLFDCPAYHLYGDMVAGRRWQPPGASLQHVGLKDTRLALEAAEAAAVPMPVAAAHRDTCLQAIAGGMGDWDWAAAAVAVEQRAGIYHPEDPKPTPPAPLPSAAAAKED